MTDRPIIFSAPMVRALLAGRKTQTRRIVKPQPRAGRIVHEQGPGVWLETGYGEIGDDLLRLPCVPEDRLWVRETWAHYQTINSVRKTDGRSFSEVSDGLAGYRADGHDSISGFKAHVRLMSGCELEGIEINGDRWRPSIHMPRWASRLTLTVTDVRVQRLKEISEADAIAEGMEEPSLRELGGMVAQAAWSNRHVYSRFWDHLHGAGAWDATPWVAAISFTVEPRNIDAHLKQPLAMEAAHG